MNGLPMKTPALLTRVSIRPKRSSVSSMTVWAVSASAMSPDTVSRPGSLEAGIARAVPTTA